MLDVDPPAKRAKSNVVVQIKRGPRESRSKAEEDAARVANDFHTPLGQTFEDQCAELESLQMKVQEAEAESLKAEAAISNLEAEAKAELESQEAEAEGKLESLEAKAAISNLEAEAQAEVESLKLKPKLKVLVAELQLAERQMVGAFADKWMSKVQLGVPKFAEPKLSEAVPTFLGVLPSLAFLGFEAGKESAVKHAEAKRSEAHRSKLWAMKSWSKTSKP